MKQTMNYTTTKINRSTDWQHSSIAPCAIEFFANSFDMSVSLVGRVGEGK